MDFLNIQSCSNCPTMSRSSRGAVVGRGDIPCRVLFLGDYPGMSEDILGEAFIGPTGKLLDKMIKDSGLGNDRVYFTNVVLCYPRIDRKITGIHDLVSRDPFPSEIAACSENVIEIIDAAQPEKIVLVGKIAETYYKKEFPTSITIQHPRLILQTGGERSPYYLKNIRILEGIKP